MSIADRKAEHLRWALAPQSQHLVSNWLEDVYFSHQAIPNIDVADVSLNTRLFGKELAAPLMISGMTGGTDRAQEINCELAALAQDVGIAFGLGSQRIMHEDPSACHTFMVRAVAPTVLLFGNVGAVQARDLGVDTVRELSHAVDADVMAIHLNPAQELIQQYGDRDFRGIYSFLRELSSDGLPIVVKETGCGISGGVARSLLGVGIEWVDVAGAGGTSWIAVEGLRATDPRSKDLAADLQQWGIPTAVSTAVCSQLGLSTIASGGIRTPMDVAAAVALGAKLVGVAGPVLSAYHDGGLSAARAYLERLIYGLRAICALTSSSRVTDLPKAAAQLSTRLQARIAGEIVGSTVNGARR